MAYNTDEERLKVRGSEQITRDLKVNRDAFINGKAETGSIDDKGDLKVAGEILAGDDVTISGDLYVNGTEYINDSETAQTTDNYLVLRHNQTTPLGTDEYSGVAVHNYASGKTATITTDKDGTWRVADNTETDTDYTNISYYNGTYYTGLTRTAATVISGMKTAFDEDELDESVYYNNSYYHFDGSHWFPVNLVDNKLTLGSAVTDSTTIAALNALTKEDLVYFRTLTITVINPVENQPLLTRAEVSDLTGGQALTWDATNERAVGKTIDAAVTASSNNLITSGAVKTAIDNAVDALDVASVGGDGKYISAISETNGKISAIATTMDTAPTADSTKAVTSGGVKTAIDDEATARNTAITNAINALDVASAGGDTKYISAISETNGKISATVKDVAQTYSSTGTTAASGKAIAAAIGTLDVASVGGAGKYISAISETDGKISATATTMDTAPTADSTKAVTSGGVKTAIDAEATARNTAITNAINALDVTDTAVSGKYVSAVSETDGKISVTRANLPSVDVSTKMDKANPTGTGSFSLNRKAGTTIGTNSFAEGGNTTASNFYSHAEGYNTTASGRNSHAEGFQTTATGANQHAQGKYNVVDNHNTYADIVGGGIDNDNRKNISALDWNGSLHLKGNIYTGCNDDSTGGAVLLPVGTIMAFYLTTAPTGWLECNGSTFDQSVYPKLHVELGSNILPDFRECTLVGIGQRGSGVAAHDEYTLGQFKDDQMQQISGSFMAYGTSSFNLGFHDASGVFNVSGDSGAIGHDVATKGNNTMNFNSSRVARTGTTTHGKQVGIMWCIKAC